MNKRLSLLVISCFLISNNAYAYKYALGSCLDQDLEQPIWKAIERQDIDGFIFLGDNVYGCLLYTSPSPRDKRQSRMPSSA